VQYSESSAEHVPSPQLSGGNTGSSSPLHPSSPQESAATEASDEYSIDDEEPEQATAAEATRRTAMRFMTQL